MAGIFEYTSFTTICVLIGTIVGGIYSVWLLNRIIFGQVSLYINYFSEINLRENIILFVLCYLNFVIGIYPMFFFNLIRSSVSMMLGFSDIGWSLLLFW